VPHDPLPVPADPRAARVRLVAKLLDELITIPGTRVGVGLDSLIGLIPGIGDTAGLLLSAGIVLQAARLGVPMPVLARMVLNVAIDALVGAFPVAGDLFDVGWKANVRNVRLMQAALDEPGATRRNSALVVGGVAAGLLAIVAGAAVLTFYVVSTLVSVIF
jgi:hypothetical protein